MLQKMILTKLTRLRLTAAIAVVVTVALTAAVPAQTPQGASSDQYAEASVTPEDDVYVAQDQPDSNFNSRAENSWLELNDRTLGLLKFTLDGAPSPVTSVKLRVVTASNGGTLTLYDVPSDSWDERSVTWITRPNLGRALTSIHDVRSGTLRIDLPAGHVPGSGTYSLALKATQASVRVRDKETRLGWRKPRLSVSDYNGTGPLGSPAVHVDACRRVGRVSDGLFSNNHRYPNGGFGILEPSTHTIKEAMVIAGRDLGVTGLRFPGGTVSETYDWREGIGPVSSRPPGYEYGIMEHMAYVEALGRDAVAWTPITLGRGRDALTVEEAAGFVEFMNSPNDGSNPNGGTDWARVRADLGHPRPYRIRYWALGNELRSHLNAWLDGGDPPRWVGLLAIRDAMKAVDPTIEVGIGWELGFDKLFAALAARDTRFDFVDVHGLEASDEGSFSAQQQHYLGIDAASHVEDYYRQAKAEIARYPQLRGMDVYSFENDAGSHALRRALHHSLANAVQLIQLVQAKVQFQSHSPYTSGPTNPFAAPIRTEHIQFDAGFQRWFFTAPSYAYRLFAHRLHKQLVETFITGNPLAEVAGWNGLPIRKLYAVAGRNGSGNMLDLLLVNADDARDHEVRIRISGFSPQPRPQVHEVNGRDITAENSLADPHAVTIVAHSPIQNAASSFDYTFPAHSVTAIRLKAERRAGRAPRC